MRTPNGRECKFFYGDYYRGRNFEECRALAAGQDKKLWSSEYCKNCPVPEIQRNNACLNLVITITLTKFFLTKRVKLFTYCTVSHGPVKDPNVGCGYCHQDQSSGSSN